MLEAGIRNDAALTAKERKSAEAYATFAVDRQRKRTDAAEGRIAEAVTKLRRVLGELHPGSHHDDLTAIHAILTAPTTPTATNPPAFGRHRWRCGQDFGQGFPTRSLVATHHGIAHRDVTCHGHPLTFNESAEPEETRAMVGGKPYPTTERRNEMEPNAPPVTVEALMALQRVTYVSTACVCDQHEECRKVRKYEPKPCACPCHDIEEQAPQPAAPEGGRTFEWSCGGARSDAKFETGMAAAMSHRAMHCNGDPIIRPITETAKEPKC